MYDVACVGIIVADAIGGTVDHMPGKGKLGLVDSIRLYSGGCAANAAIDLAKIGLNVSIIGKIGNDGFGSFLKNELMKHKIGIEGLVIGEGEATSASFVLVDSQGERSFLHCLGANATFSEEDINYDIIQKSKIIFVAGTMLIPRFDGYGCATLLKKAREMKRYTVLDTAWDSKGKWMDVLKPCMHFIDLFIPSYEEAVMLSGEKEPEKISDVFLSMGVKTSVIKLGKDGCFIKDQSGEKHSIPVYDNIKVIDTTGAGDSFAAGFITGKIKGWDLLFCGKFANAVGAQCVMDTGASTGIKSFNETLDFMKKYDLIV